MITYNQLKVVRDDLHQTALVGARAQPAHTLYFVMQCGLIRPNACDGHICALWR